jgi:hypothetical protein
MTRIYHPWNIWECYKAGFFAPGKSDLGKDAQHAQYAAMLKDIPLFESILKKVTREWRYSCEHNLTNDTMNRVAWLGQACVAYQYGISHDVMSAFNLLSKQEQDAANTLADAYLQKWLAERGRDDNVAT